MLTQSELYEKTVSNMLECKSRGAYLMGLTTYGNYEIEDQVNDTWYGMTYREDVAAVKDSFKKMLEDGVYKADLFADL